MGAWRSIVDLYFVSNKCLNQTFQRKHSNGKQSKAKQSNGKHSNGKHSNAKHSVSASCCP